MSPPADTRTPGRATTTTTTAAEPQPRPGLAGARRGGRPSRQAALALREHILDAATQLFLTQGYGLTTIEAVARQAGISKRTFYHRFADKAVLFTAVVHHMVARMRPPPEVPLLEGTTPHEVLRRLAGLILAAALSPPAIALHRLVIAESARFPAVVAAVNAHSATEEVHALVSSVLARAFDPQVLPVRAREFAAEQFLQLVVANPQRRAMGFGVPMSEAEIADWASDAATLFLRGCEGWATGKP